MNVKAKLKQTTLSRRRQSGIECHTADLDNVSASVRFRQSTYNHVRVSDCLHLQTYWACFQINNTNKNIGLFAFYPRQGGYAVLGVN